MNKNTLGIILAGNSGLGLGEISRHRPIGAVPVASRYRLVDFILSSMVNTGIDNVGIPTQTHYRSLMDHLGSGTAWDLNRKRHGLVVLPPYIGNGAEIQGDLDILNGINDYMHASQKEYVLLTQSNLMLNCNFKDMMQFHKDSGADITLMYNIIEKDMPANHVGLKANSEGRIVDIEINPVHSFSNQVSMQIAFMKRELLEYYMDRCLARGQHDLMRDVLLKEKDNLKIYGYEYKQYVGRVCDINSYYKCNMDLLNPDVSAQLFDANDRIYTKVKDQVPTIYGENVNIKNCIVADGCVIKGKVENSIIFRGVQIDEGVEIKNCVVMQDTQVLSGSKLEYAILDKGVIIRKNKRLSGQESYPVVVGKNVVV